MDALRRLTWWCLAYGSVAGLWMGASVRADLHGGPQTDEDGFPAVATVYYGPLSPSAVSLPSHDDAASPADHTLRASSAWLALKN